MTKSRPNFDPEHLDVYPIKEIDGEKFLLHCQEHQRAWPDEGEPDTPEMQKVREDIEKLIEENKIKVGNVSTGLCTSCYHKVMHGLYNPNKDE